MSRSDARQLDAAVQNSLLVDQPRKIPVQIAFRHSPVPPTASVPLHGTLVSSSVAQSGNARRTASNSENNILPSSSIVSAATPRPPQLSALANSHAMLNPSSKIDPPTTFSEIQSFTDSLGRTAAALPVDSTEDNTIVEDSEGEGAEPLLGSSERVPEKPQPSYSSSIVIESATSTHSRPTPATKVQLPSSRLPPSDDIDDSSVPQSASKIKRRETAKPAAKPPTVSVEIIKSKRAATLPEQARSNSSRSRRASTNQSNGIAPTSEDEHIPQSIPARHSTVQSIPPVASSLPPAQRLPSLPPSATVERRQSRGASRNPSVEPRYTAPIEDDAAIDDPTEEDPMEFARAEAAEANRKQDDDDEDFGQDKKKKKVSKKAVPKKGATVTKAQASRNSSKKASAADAKRAKAKSSIAELVEIEPEPVPEENGHAEGSTGAAAVVEENVAGGAVEKSTEMDVEEEIVVVKTGAGRSNKRQIVQDSDDEAEANDSGYVGEVEKAPEPTKKGKKIARQPSKTAAGRPNRNKAKQIIESDPSDGDADSIIATDKEDAVDDSDDSSGSPQKKKKKSTTKEKELLVMAAAKEVQAANPFQSTSAIAPARQASVQAAASFRAPSSNTKPKPRRGLSAVLQKSGVHGNRAPGLSMRSKVPRLHSTLKERPPERDPLPKEKLKPRKKGDEDYSDEERPWYETKHVDDWDSDDREEWKKIAKKREDGY